MERRSDGIYFYKFKYVWRVDWLSFLAAWMMIWVYVIRGSIEWRRRTSCDYHCNYWFIHNMSFEVLTHFFLFLFHKYLLTILFNKQFQEFLFDQIIKFKYEKLFSNNCSVSFENVYNQPFDQHHQNMHGGVNYKGHSINETVPGAVDYKNWKKMSR